MNRRWEDSLVPEVCRLLADDLPLAPGAPGGMVEYRRTLTTSFFFKFYLTVLMQLQARVSINNILIEGIFQFDGLTYILRDYTRGMEIRR